MGGFVSSRQLLCLKAGALSRRGGILSEEQRIVVIGASAGGVDALRRLVRDLPADFPAPVCVVLHIPPDSPSLLAQILNREGTIPAKTAEHGERYQPRMMYVAPPDRHLLVARDGTLHLSRGPRENRSRPAVDPLFRSAAVAAGPAVIAVVLTGSLDDGTAGLFAVKKRRGIAVVQDPADAMYPSMPQSALTHVEVDHLAPIAGMGQLLSRLVYEPIPDFTPPADRDMDLEARMADLEQDALATDDRPGEPSPYSCPDCGGVLWEIQEEQYVRYRCRVGHAFSPEAMLSAQDDVLEEALWSAMKTLEESARLSHRLAATERQRGHDWLVERFEEKEREARARVEVIRRYLLRTSDSTVPQAVTNA
jgi:two-component system, chemotaxis family, protein-glutamate methylesterase/glutaminase